MELERSHHCGGSGREEASKEEAFLSEIGRRWCTNSEHKHTWHHRSDVVSFPEIRPTTTLLNRLRQPSTFVSNTESNSFPPSAPPVPTGQKATRAAWTACSVPKGVVGTVPVSCEEPESRQPIRPTRHWQEPTELPVGRPEAQPDIAARKGRKTTLCNCPTPPFPSAKALTPISRT